MDRARGPVFIGRRVELQCLEDALERVTFDGSAVILIGGDAGVGKTRLFGEFQARCEGDRARFLVGACMSLGDSPYAFAPFVDAFRSLVRSLDANEASRVLGPGRIELARLLPEVGGGPGALAVEPSGVAQSRLFERILGLLERLAAERPVVLGLEDLHWADRATLHLLRFLARYARQIPLLLVCTYRTNESARERPLRALLAEFDRLPNVTRSLLQPFNRDEVAEFVAAHRGDAPPDLVNALVARSEGNAFFLEQLLAADGSGVPEDGLPVTLEEVLLARVARVPRAAQEVIRAVALAGGWIDDAVLERLPRRYGALRALVTAVDSGEVVAQRRGGRDGYAVRHALVAEAVRQAVLPAERRAIHAALAGAFAGAGGAMGRAERTAARAHHLCEAQEHGAALAASIEAGMAAEKVLAHTDALVHFERALELWARVDDAGLSAPCSRADLLERAADAAISAGERARAVTLLREAIDRHGAAGDPTEMGTLLHRLSRYLLEAGDAPAAIRTLETAIERLPARPVSALRGQALAEFGRHLAAIGQLEAARPVLDEADAIAESLGPSPERLAVSCVVAHGRALSSLHEGDTARAFELAHGARMAASTAPLPGAFTDLCGIESFLLDDRGRYDEVVDLALAGRARLKELGLEIRYGLGLMWRVALTQLLLGRWADVERTVESTLDAGPMPDKAAALHEIRAIVRARQGRLHEARSDLEAWRELVSAGAVLGQGWGGAETAVAALEGRWTDIRAMTAERIDENPCRDTDPVIAYDCYEGVRAEAEEASRARGSRDLQRIATCVGIAAELDERIHLVVAAAERHPAGAGVKLRAFAAATDAERSRAEGRSDPALWELARELWQALGMTYEVCYSTYRRAEALLALRRSPATARQLLADAHEGASRLGAEPLQRDIEELARRARIELGQPPDRHAQTRRALDGPGLSERERQVLDLLIDGRSNREIAQALFISDKTASVHVSHILDKLGVTSRGAAVAAVVRAGREADPLGSVREAHTGQRPAGARAPAGDWQAHDPQTRDPQTRDPQTRDPQARDLQARDRAPSVREVPMAGEPLARTMPGWSPRSCGPQVYREASRRNGS